MSRPLKLNLDNVLEAAIVCFSQSGVAATSLAEVAKQAKMDPPLLTYHFKSKDLLLERVIDYILESLRTFSIQAIEKAGHDPRKKLIQYAIAPLQWGRKNPEYYSAWIYFYHATTFSERLLELNTRIRMTGRERIEFLLLQGLNEKLFELPNGMKVQETAHLVQALITGQGILGGTETDIKLVECEKMLTKSLKAILSF